MSEARDRLIEVMAKIAGIGAEGQRAHYEAASVPAPLVLTDEQRVAVWRLLTDEILTREGQRVWHADPTGADGLREVADAIRSGRGIR